MNQTGFLTQAKHIALELEFFTQYWWRFWREKWRSQPGQRIPTLIHRIRTRIFSKRSTLKDLRDDGYIAFYGAIKLFSKRKQQPKQHDTAVVNNVDSDDDAVFDAVDEVHQGGWAEGDGLISTPARRLSNSDDSTCSNRPLQSHWWQKKTANSSGSRGRGRGRRGAGGGDGGEHITPRLWAWRVHGGSGSYHRSSSGRAAPADEAAREASPVSRPRTRKQTNISAADNKVAAGRTPLFRFC